MFDYFLKKICFISFYLYICGHGQQFEGDKCVLQSTGANGTCRLLSNCTSALQLIVRREYPENCGFQSSIPIVCCEDNPEVQTTVGRPLTSPRTRRLSDQKCQEYGKSVFKVFKAPILKPTIERVNRSLCKITAKRLIVGGTKADPKEFPHMAILGFDNQDEIEWGCGGSLISEHFVLTAAHCIYSQQFGVVKYVRVGDLNIRSVTDDVEPQEFTVVQRIRHPDYKPPSQYHDIALLRLNDKAKFNEFVRPICLHSTYHVDSKKAIATGWGKTDNYQEASNDLLKVILDFYPYSDCKKVFSEGVSKRRLSEGIVDESQICAGGVNESKDTCQGDSGGPLQIYHHEVYCMYSLVGITSFGKACGSVNSPGVYTRVSNYISWIENIVWGALIDI